MRRFLKYAWYITRHKWFVLVAGLKIGTSVWRLLLHDISKLLPSEWGPYARCFYADDGSSRYEPSQEFDMAWLRHQQRNKHHWQYWVLIPDQGQAEPMPMPAEYVYEMVADWAGAGRAITGKWEVATWYANNRQNIFIHEETDHLVNLLLIKHFNHVDPAYKIGGQPDEEK